MHLNGLGAQRSCPVAVQFLKAVAERGPWGAQLERAHTMLQVIGQVGREGGREGGGGSRPFECACRAVSWSYNPNPNPIPNPSPNPSPNPNPNPSSNPNQDGQLEAPLQMYAALAEGGYEVAQSNVAFLLDQHVTHKPDEPLLGMQPEQVAARAADMFRRAAQQGNFEAELKLGDYHYYGQGTPVDLEAAVYHYRTAAEARNAQAMFNLAWMYAHGEGVARDFHLAKRHYDMAAETSTEAAVPVALALLEMYARQLYGGGGSGGQAGAPLNLLGEGLGFLPEWDTLLIIGLTITLVGVLVAQRQLLGAAPN